MKKKKACLLETGGKSPRVGGRLVYSPQSDCDIERGPLLDWLDDPERDLENEELRYLEEDEIDDEDLYVYRSKQLT